MNTDLILARVRKRVTVDPQTGCHVWTGSLTNGYGYVSVEGQSWRVHRLTYTLAKGPIPRGLVLDHLCRNKACCNPDHLEAVTNRENGLRGDGPAARYWRTHCARGHARTPENTYVKPDGERECRICKAEDKRAWDERKVARRTALVLSGARCIRCRPVLRMTEGADHVGLDFFLRCPRCGTRTTHHIEGERKTPEIEAMLRREWRAGKTETPTINGERE